MAEHNIDTLLKALEDAQESLTHYQKERTAARQVVAAVVNLLRRTRSTLHHLQRERDLRRKPDENAGALENLRGQLQKSQEEEAQAKKNLQDAQRRLRGVEFLAPSAQAGASPRRSQATGQEGHEANADDIQKKKQEEQWVQDQIREAREVLKEKKRAVLDAAVTVTRTAARVPLQQAKAFISNLATKLPSFGGVSLGYGYAVALGAVYELVFYRLHGINIFLYSTSSDFLLSGYKLFYIPLLSFIPALLLLLFYWLLVKLACLRIRGYAEFVAQRSPHFARGIPVKSTSVLLFLVLPISTAAGVGCYQSKQNLKNQVSIVAVPPLQQDGPFFRIGANSTYLFLKKTEPTKSPVLPVQLSRVAYISECEAKDTKVPESGFMPGIPKHAEEIKNWLFPPAPIRECQDNGEGKAVSSGKAFKPGAAAFRYEMLEYAKEIKNNLKPPTPPKAHDHEGFVTEKRFLSYLAANMGCHESEVQRSDFIRFDRDEPEPQYQTPYFKKDSPQRQAIQEFVEKNEKEAKQWAVFGFASLDGHENHNSALAARRAEVVEDVRCAALNGKGPDQECNDPRIITKGMGEEHPINGVANGRSAVIAVCMQKDEQDSGKDEDNGKEG